MNTEIQKAIKLLDNDDLVVIPTETVYGLAANAYSEKAIEKIFKTKNRPANNPLIVHIGRIEDLSKVCKNIPKRALQLATHFWPGPLTILFEKADHLSPKITAGKTTVAVRIPNHPTTLTLLNHLKYPLVAPSANRSNHISPTSPEHVTSSLGTETPFILDGGFCSRGIESTIVGFDGNTVKIYRLGAIEKEEIERVLGCDVVISNNTSEVTVAPGMSAKHYAPKTAFITTQNIEKEIEKYSNKKIGLMCFSSKHLNTNAVIVKQLTLEEDMKQAAANLYKIMHELDQLNLDLIIAELMPNIGIGISINDRLIRASSY